MSPAAQQIYASALALPPSDRERLAELLWVSLGSTDPEAIAASWDAEIARRVEADERGEGRWLSEDQVMQRLEAKHGPL